MPELLALLGLAISGTQAAQDLWQMIRPILEARRDPTAAEWATLNALADQAHADVQRP